MCRYSAHAALSVAHVFVSVCATPIHSTPLISLVSLNILLLFLLVGSITLLCMVESLFVSSVSIGVHPRLHIHCILVSTSASTLHTLGAYTHAAHTGYNCATLGVVSQFVLPLPSLPPPCDSVYGCCVTVILTLAPPRRPVVVGTNNNRDRQSYMLHQLTLGIVPMKGSALWPRCCIWRISCPKLLHS